MLDSTTTPLLLGLIIIVPFVLLSQQKGWTKTSLNKLNLLPKLRQWRNRPKQSSEIVSLRMYPIKSCRGFEVQSTTLKEHGLDLDRRWMLVDASNNEFLTIRQIPDMTRISTNLSPDTTELIISIPTTKSRSKTVRIPSHPDQEWLASHTSIGHVKIWDNETDAHIYSKEINAPFSAFLGRPVSLVYKGPTPRVLKGNGAPHLLGRAQSTGFPDVFPVLIASEASLAELNARLKKIDIDPITVERFRPNIIIRGQKPWVEDSWKTVRIRASDKKKGPDEVEISHAGDHSSSSGKPLDLDIVARCARCQVPNVDPETAQKHKKQPWDTLISYRRVDEGIKWKPCFGMLSAPRNEGAIEVGMRLEVLEETNEHRYVTGF